MGLAYVYIQPLSKERGLAWDQLQQNSDTDALIFILFYFATWHVRFLFPSQGSNLDPLKWKRGVNYWTAREVPLMP